MDVTDPFARAAAARGVTLAPALAAFHGAPGIWRGQADVTHGRGPLIRLALRLGGFPPPGTCAVRLETRRDPDTWTRDFGGHVTRSRLSHDARRAEIIECFGPFAIRMAPKPAPGGGMDLAITGLSLLGLPLPAPRSATSEGAETAQRMTFDVAASLPFLGLLIRYKGYLERCEDDHADHIHHPD